MKTDILKAVEPIHKSITIQKNMVSKGRKDRIKNTTVYLRCI